MYKLSQITVLMSFCCIVDSARIIKKPVEFPPTLLEHIIPGVERCIIKTNAGPEVLLVIFDGKYMTDKKFREFLYCCWKEAGYLQVNGRMDYRPSSAFFRTEPMVVTGWQACKKMTPRNLSPEDELFNVYKCFHDTVPIRFFVTM